MSVLDEMSLDAWSDYDDGPEEPVGGWAAWGDGRGWEHVRAGDWVARTPGHRSERVVWVGPSKLETGVLRVGLSYERREPEWLDCRQLPFATVKRAGRFVPVRDLK